MSMKVENISKTDRLIIVDPSLKDTRGHHYALTLRIVENAVKNSFETIVFSNRSTENMVEITGARVVPVFSMSTYEYCKLAQKKDEMSLKQKLHLAFSLRSPESLKIILRKIRGKLTAILVKAGVSAGTSNSGVNYDMLNELLDAMLNENVTSDDHIIIHTADAMIYRLLLQLLQKKYPLGEYPCLHICTPYDMQVMPHVAEGMPVEKVINYLQLMGLINRNVFLYAENELLADLLTLVWKVEVSPLDIPMKKCDLKSSGHRIDDAVFRVVYLGAAREEKGFHLLPNIMETVLKEIRNEFPIQFVIQCSSQITGYTKKIAAAIDKLQKLSGNNVRLIMRQQSNREYYDTLDSADVVLCCYQLENYRVRGSGIATEAVAYGKTVIATPGTYPAWLAGDAGCPATGSKEIGVAILSVLNDRDGYKAKAMKRAEWFFERTRPEQYVNKLLAKEEGAKRNHAITGRTGQAQICPGAEQSQRTAENAINASAQDDANSENKYNVKLFDADISVDGKLLFIKQISS